MPVSPRFCKAALFLALPAAVFTARADWLRDDAALAWRNGTNVVWRFSFDSTKGKPFFHPVSLPGGPALTNFKPEDHPWHYGLWFSWKYINHANYWEEDRQTGKAEGRTLWTTPAIETTPDGSARMRLELSYLSPSNQIDLTERRELVVSAPEPDGAYAINWTSHFVAGTNGALLDRWPMPDEPNGKINGGYAGLSLRMAGPPLGIAFVSSTGVVSHFEGDRARPAAAAAGCNFTQNGAPAGSIALFSHPANAGENAPWYLINSETMRFVCAAILAPKPRTLRAGETFDLRYRIQLRREPWTPETLQDTAARAFSPERFRQK